MTLDAGLAYVTVEDVSLGVGKTGNDYTKVTLLAVDKNGNQGRVYDNIMHSMPWAQGRVNNMRNAFKVDALNKKSLWGRSAYAALVAGTYEHNGVTKDKMEVKGYAPEAFVEDATRKTMEKSLEYVNEGRATVTAAQSKLDDLDDVPF